MAKLGFLVLVLFAAFAFLFATAAMSKLVGAPKQVDAAENDLSVQEHAKYAVEEHNRQNPEAHLTFKKLVNAKKQVVSGNLYHLTIEAEHKEKGTQLYDAQVWTKDWEGSKQLKEFKLHDSVGTGGLRTLPVDDPAVKDAAEYAIKALQQRSNSLFPYELQHVVEAKGKASENTSELDLLLKVKRGEKEEHVKASVCRAEDGKWALKHHQLQ